MLQIVRQQPGNTVQFHGDRRCVNGTVKYENTIYLRVRLMMDKCNCLCIQNAVKILDNTKFSMLIKILMTMQYYLSAIMRTMTSIHHPFPVECEQAFIS